MIPGADFVTAISPMNNIEILTKLKLRYKEYGEDMLAAKKLCFF